MVREREKVFRNSSGFRFNVSFVDCTSVQKRHSSAVVLTQWPHWVCSTTTNHRNVTILACKMVPGTVLVLRSCKVFIQSSAAGCSVTITFKSP